MYFQFGVLLTVIFILEIAAGIAGFVLRGKVEGYVEDYMDRTLKHKNKVWDEVQKDVSIDNSETSRGLVLFRKCQVNSLYFGYW